ncbi:MAG: hypothetical protein ACXVBH_11770, partial [Flavisolibacter sp.]
MKFLHLIKNTPLTLTSKLTLLAFSLAFGFRGNSQNISSGLLADTSSAIEEKLVQLAWQGPEVQKTA